MAYGNFGGWRWRKNKANSKPNKANRQPSAGNHKQDEWVGMIDLKAQFTEWHLKKQSQFPKDQNERYYLYRKELCK